MLEVSVLSQQILLLGCLEVELLAHLQPLGFLCLSQLCHLKFCFVISQFKLLNRLEERAD